MRLIDTEDAAKRLARVILSDIEIYNRDKIRTREDLKSELNEGYVLFRSRVAPELVPLFSQVVADRWLDADTEQVAASPHLDQEPEQPPAPPPPAAPPPRTGSLDPTEAARRLARVMVSGIAGCDREDGGAGLNAEIAEARKLFASCVLPEQAALFQEALAERGLLDEPRLRLVPPEPVAVAPVAVPPQAVDWKLSRARLAVVATAVTAASASLVYVFLTAF